MPEQSYPVHVPFNPTPADVFAVCCCDGRYIKATAEFLISQGVGRHDLLAFPGGPAVMEFQTGEVAHHFAVTHAFDFMVHLHHTRLAVLIAHSDCAYYFRRYGQSDEARQKRDLQNVGRQLASKFPDLQVALYYAHVASEPGSGFIFESVPGDSTEHALVKLKPQRSC